MLMTATLPRPPLRDPTAETAPTERMRRPPLVDLEGRTLALMDIGKMRGSEFIDRLEMLLNARGVANRRYAKPTNTRTAPIELLKTIVAECDAVIIALSDCGSCTSCSTHDLNELDARGLPGISVLTEEFESAFENQCQKIGFAGASVYVPHPMQNRTTAELHAFADAAVGALLGAVSRLGDQGSGDPA